MPVGSHIKEQGANFHRFGAVWTPTILVLDPEGVERWRIEGYLPTAEFRAQLETGLARVAFVHQQWEEAERRYAEIVARYPQTAAAPEAVYWRGVSRYKGTKDHAALGAVADRFKEKYRESVWARKASVWSR